MKLINLALCFLFTTVPKDDNERRNEKDKGREQDHQTPELENGNKQHELSVERYNLSKYIEEDSDKIDMEDDTKEAGKKVTMHRETNLERLKEGVSGVKINDEASHKFNVYRPFQDSNKVVGAKKDMYSHKEEFSVYGEHVGNQLRSLTDRHSLKVARYEIDRVIFKAIMGEYYVGSCQCCFQDSSTDSYTPRSSPRSPQASNSPAFQPYRTSVETPIQPQPIRPQLSIEPWTGVKQY